MIAESPAKDVSKESEGNAGRGLRAHAVGLIGANLVVGSLFLWVLPLLARLWHRPAPGALQRLAPWAAGDGGPASLVYGAAAISAMALGVVLLVRAARRLNGPTESSLPESAP